jgi:hypothetical protein
VYERNVAAPEASDDVLHPTYHKWMGAVLYPCKSRAGNKERSNQVHLQHADAHTYD